MAARSSGTAAVEPKTPPVSVFKSVIDHEEEAEIDPFTYRPPLTRWDRIKVSYARAPQTTIFRLPIIPSADQGSHWSVKIN